MAIGIVGLVFATAANIAAPLTAIDAQLTKLGSDTALVFPSGAVDEHPLWSLTSEYLAVNIEGEWQKINLRTVVLAPGTWRGGQTIGVIQNRAAVSAASSAEVAAWQKLNTLNPRRAVVGQTVVELRQSEFSTQLVVTKPARQPEIRWVSDEENCHSLVVAPDRQHVAFICEENGVFILRLSQ